MNLSSVLPHCQWVLSSKFEIYYKTDTEDLHRTFSEWTSIEERQKTSSWILWNTLVSRFKKKNPQESRCWNSRRWKRGLEGTSCQCHKMLSGPRREKQKSSDFILKDGTAYYCCYILVENSMAKIKEIKGYLMRKRL